MDRINYLLDGIAPTGTPVNPSTDDSDSQAVTTLVPEGYKITSWDDDRRAHLRGMWKAHQASLARQNEQV